MTTRADWFHRGGESNNNNNNTVNERKLPDPSRLEELAEISEDSGLPTYICANQLPPLPRLPWVCQHEMGERELNFKQRKQASKHAAAAYLGTLVGWRRVFGWVKAWHGTNQRETVWDPYEHESRGEHSAEATRSVGWEIFALSGWLAGWWTRYLTAQCRT